ncbi:MAG: CBS domain-containing protein [Alphaproteobacteria bacterium]|nr:CBS domain-containing protein [Alphaproteobacteria bacterium]
MRVLGLLRRDNAFCVSADERIAAVGARLAVDGVRLACVCTVERKLLGVVTSGDIKRAALSGRIEYREWPVQSVMTAAVVTCAPEDDLDGVLDLMQQHEMHTLPVVTGGRVVGCVSLAEALAQSREETRRHVDYLTAFVFGAAA